MNKDRTILRDLAAQVADIAASPEQADTVRAWKRLNSLDPERPMVWITEIPWGEFEDSVDELKLTTEDKRSQQIERTLRRTLFTARHLPCDEVISDTWYVPKHITGADYGVQIEEEQIAQGASNVRSHAYQPVIKNHEDIEKIQMPSVCYDERQTRAEVTFFRELFGDILSVEAAGPRHQFFPAWDRLVRWTGVTEALMDLIARPDFIHSIMRRITDSYLERMKQYEEQGLLDYPHPRKRVGSGGAGFTDELPQPDADPAHIRTLDQWGGATSQIFSDVSPEMHDEFALSYENEVMARCGLNYYGCCEPLHNKMHLLAKVPRLRKISISHWCDTAQAVANARGKYVFSHKPTPASLAHEHFNEREAAEDIRQRLKQSEDMPCEIIMKDISTVKGDVNRLISWCQMASSLVRER